MAPCAALLAVLAVNTFAANALLPPQQLRVTAHRSAATARRSTQLDGPSEFDVAEGDEATAAAMRSMMQRAAKEERRAAANSDPVAPFTGMDDRRVPASQEPVNELAIVRSQFLMDWAELPFGALLRNLGVAFGGTFALVGLPIVNNYDECVISRCSKPTTTARRRRRVSVSSCTPSRFWRRATTAVGQLGWGGRRSLGPLCTPPTHYEGRALAAVDRRSRRATPHATRYNELVNFTGAQTVALALLPAALVLAALMTRLFAAWCVGRTRRRLVRRARVAWRGINKENIHNK